MKQGIKIQVLLDEAVDPICILQANKTSANCSLEKQQYLQCTHFLLFNQNCFLLYFGVRLMQLLEKFLACYAGCQNR